MQKDVHYDVMRDNNEAVSLIASGRIEQAIQLLSRALEVTKKSLIAFSEDDDVVSDTQEESFTPNHTTVDQNMYVGRLAPMHPDEDPTQGYEEHSYFIYSKGIRMETLNSPNSHRAMIISSTIIIFNLALAFHLSTLSVSHQSRRIAGLTKALQLYGLALTLQEREQVKGNTFFTLATVNNMGVIQRLLGESEKKTREYFEFVLSNLLPLFTCGEKFAFPLTDFFHNAVSVLNGQRTSAPAA